MKKIMALGCLLSVIFSQSVVATDSCSCIGYSGPGGPCYAGPGGACYSGVGGPWYRGVGGPAYDGVGGPCYAGVGGACYSGIGGTGINCPSICTSQSTSAVKPKKCIGYAGPGGPCYAGPGGPAYDGVGGPCYAGVGGACYSGIGGTGINCPSICQQK